MKIHQREYKSPLLSIGRYRCWHGTVEVGHEQQSYTYAISVTQRGAFALHRDGQSAIADRTVAAVFNQGDVYRTSHPDVCEDDGYFLSFRGDVLLDVLARRDPRVLEQPERPFRHITVPLSPRATLLGAALLRDVAARQRGVGPLELDERALEWLDALMATVSDPRTQHANGARGANGPRGTAGAGTLRAHRELADAACRLLALRFAEPIALPDIASALGVSPFHLCRVFRSVTGSTLHARLEHNRLSAALDAVSDPQRDLSRIALDHGYSSHSHFTARFHRAFGVTPSQFRRAGS